MVMKLVVLLITRPQLRSTMPGTAARIIWTAPHEIYAVEAVHEIRGNFGVCRKVGLRIAAKAADADAGIVEEDVDAAEAVNRIPDGAFAVRFPGDIVRERDGGAVPMRLVDVQCHLFGSCEIDVRHRDPDAARGNGACHGCSYPAAAAGYHRNPGLTH
jgi:hypothetical protein